MVVCLEGWLVKVSLFDSFTVAKTGKQKFKVDLARNRIQLFDIIFNVGYGLWGRENRP